MALQQPSTVDGLALPENGLAGFTADLKAAQSKATCSCLVGSGVICFSQQVLL
jgi:hypothetical protein